MLDRMFYGAYAAWGVSLILPVVFEALTARPLCLARHTACFCFTMSSFAESAGQQRDRSCFPSAVAKRGVQGLRACIPPARPGASKVSHDSDAGSHALREELLGGDFQSMNSYGCTPDHLRCAFVVLLSSLILKAMKFLLSGVRCW